MYRRILIPIDGSEPSNAALKHAIGLAGAHGAQLQFVYVVDTVTFARQMRTARMDVEPMYEAARQHGREILAAAERSAREAGVQAEAKLIELRRESDRVSDGIVAQAEAWPADLVVIGSHGRRGLDRFVLGSVAEAVVRQAAVPVLLLRAG